MQHAREDYQRIQDNADAVSLAELVLSMDMVTEKGTTARQLARQVLGIEAGAEHAPLTSITTNGTTRLIPADEPVFLIRGQDACGGDAVRAWAHLAEARGADDEIVGIARAHAAKMDDWPKHKVPDLPVQA